jgi:acyl-CoA synthetase (AMP-forming)/AMP-acid ligase II
MIIGGGENVYSVEVENVLSTHPHVAEVAVIGIPDDRWGEVVMAIVVARDTVPTAEELTTFCRGEIAGYKIPKRIEVTQGSVAEIRPRHNCQALTSRALLERRRAYD